MKTVSIKVYSFEELSETAPAKAIQHRRNNNYYHSHYFDEVTNSVKAAAELFNLKFGRRYTDIRTGHIENDILQMQGVRLYKYILNNYGHALFKPKYIKHTKGHKTGKQFVFKHGGTGDNKYTSIYSKLWISQDCVLTGVCYDLDILEPIYNFLERPDSSTWEDLIKGIEHAAEKAYQDVEDWTNSDEFLREELLNDTEEYTEEGEIFEL